MQQPPASTGLAVERREHVLRLLASEGRVVACDLAQDLGVSLDTVRRDLQGLAEAGLLRRVRGGALPRTTPVPAEFSARRGRHPQAKAAIAAAAAKLVRAGGVLLLGGGTTMLELARSLPGDLEGTAITPSPDVAIELVARHRLEVVLLGGRLHPRARTVVGAEVVDAVREVRADTLVLGACSVHAEAGLTLLEREEATVERAMVAAARRVVVVADAEKLGAVAPFSVATADAIETVVTDAEAPEDAVAALRDRGVEVVRA